jgi:hypothetical protein
VCVCVCVRKGSATSQPALGRSGVGKSPPEQAGVTGWGADDWAGAEGRQQRADSRGPTAEGRQQRADRRGPTAEVAACCRPCKIALSVRWPRRLSRSDVTRSMRFTSRNPPHANQPASLSTPCRKPRNCLLCRTAACMRYPRQTDRVLYPAAAAKSPPGSGLIIRRRECPPVNPRTLTGRLDDPDVSMLGQATRATLPAKRTRS